MKYKKIVNIGYTVVVFLYLAALFVFPDWREFETFAGGVLAAVIASKLYITLKYDKDK